MNKWFTFRFTITSWLLAVGLYYLVALHGPDNWPEWASSTAIVYWSWLFFSILLGGIHGLFFLISDSPRFRRRSYGFFIAVQVVFIIGISLFAYVVDVIMVVISGEILFSDFLSFYWDIISSNLAIGFLAYMTLITASLTFLRQIMLKVGTRVLGNLIIGRYYNPREEDRIFLFLDMKSSTQHVEQLGNLKYSQLIQDCFVDLTDSLIRQEVEIYQYIGDEAVMTWKVNDGVRNANCIRVYFDFMNTLELKKDYYQNKYGLQPFFKAGVNVGSVVVTEVGVVRREIAYLSEVLHTAARIQGKCNEYSRGILVSTELRELLETSRGVIFDSIGFLPLRGKSENEELFGVQLEEKAKG
jgi:adenylate cyclase